MSFSTLLSFKLVKMKLLILVLACCAASQATVLRWLGVANTDEDTSDTPESATPLPQEAPAFYLPDLARRLLDAQYLSSPQFNYGAIPVRFSSVVEPRRPLIPTSILAGPQTQIPGPFAGESVAPSQQSHLAPGIAYNIPYLLQYPNGQVFYISNGLNNLGASSGNVHTEYNIPGPVATNFQQPTGGSVIESHGTQKLPAHSSANFHNSNYNLPTANQLDLSTTTTVKPFEFPTNQQLPYSSASEFQRPAFFASTPLPDNSEFVQNDESQHENSQELPEGQNNRVSQHAYTLGDGTRVAEETNVITSADGTTSQLVKAGEYEYVDQNGVPVQVKWVADDHGFRVVS